MALFYNIEVNLSTVIILVIIKIAIRRSLLNLSTDKLLFHQMLDLNIVFSVSNIFTHIFKGTHFFYSSFVLHLSNMVYIEAMTLISYLWVFYVYNRIGKDISLKSKLIWGIPFFFVTILLLINPFTDIIFTIDDNNIYTRNPGLYLHWAASWFYIIAGTILAIIAIHKTKNKLKKRYIRPLVYLIICPAVSSIFQMLFYGLSTTQIGLAIGMFLIFVITLGNEISLDTLTKLNNRGGMENFLQNQFDNYKKQDITLFMLDLNNFKMINDKFGHNMGDRAIKDAASILKKVCSISDEKIFLCRYGGDEFVMVSRDLNTEKSNELIKAVRRESIQKNIENNNFYEIEFSIGFSNGLCSSYEDIEALLVEADKKMYENKQELKNLSKGI